MPTPLPIGIIGLGRRWRRYQPALAALHRGLDIRALCDQVRYRAEREARRLGCIAAAGPVELLERPDVRAVLLLDAQWFGLWPLEMACRLNKPVYCATSLATDDDHADELRRLVSESRLPVLMALAPACAPAMERLRALLADSLGPVRLVRGDCFRPAASHQPPPLHSGMMLGRVHACATLLDGDPVSVQASANEAAGFASLLLDFGAGRLAHVTLGTAPEQRSAVSIQALADRGTARAELPRLLTWRGADGRHSHLLPKRPVVSFFLQRFLDCLAAGQAMRPGFDEAYRALIWLRAARRSLVEGKTVSIETRG